MKFIRSQKGKALLIGSLAAWILFTLPLGLIQPPASGCLSKFNETDYIFKQTGQYHPGDDYDKNIITYGEQ